MSQKPSMLPLRGNGWNAMVDEWAFGRGVTICPVVMRADYIEYWVIPVYNVDMITACAPYPLAKTPPAYAAATHSTQVSTA